MTPVTVSGLETRIRHVFGGPTTDRFGLMRQLEWNEGQG